MYIIDLYTIKLWYDLPLKINWKQKIIAPKSILEIEKVLQTYIHRYVYAYMYIYVHTPIVH